MKFAQGYSPEEWKALIKFFQQFQSEQKETLSSNTLESQKDTLIDDSDKLFKEPFVLLKDIFVVSKLNIKEQIQKTNKDYFEKILENLHKECEEEGFKVFDEKARINAKQILDFLCENFPENDYDIYPTEDREIDICYTPYKGCSILIICDSDGSVAYFKILNERKSRYRCQDIIDFPFDQLHKEKEFEILKLSGENEETSKLGNNEIFRVVNNEYKVI